jgi:hypothetical protein
MENELLFIESQRFKQPWLWAILLGADVLVLYTVLTKVWSGQSTGLILAAFVPLVILILVNVLFAMLRLETVIKQDGIAVWFYPFHLKYKHYPWSKIAQAYVREYNPIGEYGGWGIRLGLFGRGRAYNVSGDKGIQLVFTDGSRLLIGTNKPEEADAALQKTVHLTV